MNACILELKIRARLGLNALHAGETALLERARAVSGLPMAHQAPWKLRHTLTLAARSVGFRTWDQARSVLGGMAKQGDDMGTFWHAPRCEGLLNHWFADVADARACMAAARPGMSLLPYRRQYIVVDAPFIAELGLSSELLSAHACHDLVAAYGSPGWRAVCEARLCAPAPHWLSHRQAPA